MPRNNSAKGSGAMNTMVAFEKESERVVLQVGSSRGARGLEVFREQFENVLVSRPESVVVDLTLATDESEDLQFAYVAVVASLMERFEMPRRSVAIVSPGTAIRRSLLLADLATEIPVVDTVGRALGAGQPQLVDHFTA